MRSSTATRAVAGRSIARRPVVRSSIARRSTTVTASNMAVIILPGAITISRFCRVCLESSEDLAGFGALSLGPVAAGLRDVRPDEVLLVLEHSHWLCLSETDGVG